MSDPTPAETVTSMYAAFRRGDLAAVFAHLHDDCVWKCHAPPSLAFSGTWRGPAGAAQFFEKVFQNLRMESFSVERTLADGDVVVGIGRDRGVAIATGRAYDAAWVHVWRFRDGKA